MKFSGTIDIKASLNDTFAALADFEYFENAARRAGIKIKHSDALTAPGPGMAWAAELSFRGKDRDLDIELVDYDPPNALFFKAVMGGVETSFVVQLTRIKSTLTQANVSAEITATTFPARLLLRSLKITKPAINHRFQGRLAWLGLVVQSRAG